MAKCPRCSQRKGKRPCPALGISLCPQCCAAGRLSVIACPATCEFLAGEVYQHARRKDLAVSRGRALLASNESLSGPGLQEIAFRLEADLYYFQKKQGPLSDTALEESLATVRAHLAPRRILIAGATAPHPAVEYLLARLSDDRRFPVGSPTWEEDRDRALSFLVSQVRQSVRDAPAAPPGEPTTHHFGLLESFFGALDFEADLNYSPDDPRPGEEPISGGERAPGGLILPG